MQLEIEAEIDDPVKVKTRGADVTARELGKDRIPNSFARQAYSSTSRIPAWLSDYVPVCPFVYVPVHSILCFTASPPDGCSKAGAHTMHDAPLMSCGWRHRRSSGRQLP